MGQRSESALPDQFGHFPILRETPRYGLGKNFLAVGNDLEGAAVAGHQFGFRAELLTQFRSQPGSAGLVVSAGAVFNGDLHGKFSCKGMEPVLTFSSEFSNQTRSDRFIIPKGFSENHVFFHAGHIH